jgi:predicted membrane protein
MSDDIGYNKNPRNGKALAGVILLMAGIILLFREFDFFFIPHWLFTFPMLPIAFGLFIGARSNFRKPAAFLLILFGFILLIDENVSGASHFMWPVGIIIFGLWLILRRNSSFSFDSANLEKRFVHKWDKHNNNWKHWNSGSGSWQNSDEPAADYASSTVPPVNPGSFGYKHAAGDDYLDTVSVFGGVKKIILSKDFKGGEIVNIFGGAELDFTLAEINGRVVIDIVQIFGGTKIIVPSHWRVVSDLAAVFAGVDDKRIKNTATADSDKVLVLTGVSIFAGVDIRSY